MRLLLVMVAGWYPWRREELLVGLGRIAGNGGVRRLARRGRVSRYREPSLSHASRMCARPRPRLPALPMRAPDGAVSRDPSRCACRARSQRAPL